MENTSAQPQTPPQKDCCGTGTCGKCLHGGLPMRKDMLSFVVLLAIALSTVLTVLVVSAKREIAQLKTNVPDDAEKTMVANASPTPYPVTAARSYAKTIGLPAPKLTGTMPLEEAIVSRRSRRAFSDKKVTLAEISQMLWSGQGITDATGKRTAPSARESYSMTLFVFVRDAQGIEPGLYEYLPKENALGRLPLATTKDVMTAAGVQQGAIDAPVVFLVTSSYGNYEAFTKSHNMNATYMEAGHIGQNMYLQAESLGMGTVTMAGFDNAKVTGALGIDPTLTVEYILPFGHRAPETPAVTTAKE